MGGFMKNLTFLALSWICAVGLVIGISKSALALPGSNNYGVAITADNTATRVFDDTIYVCPTGSHWFTGTHCPSDTSCRAYYEDGKNTAYTQTCCDWDYLCCPTCGARTVE